MTFRLVDHLTPDNGIVSVHGGLLGYVWGKRSDKQPIPGRPDNDSDSAVVGVHHHCNRRTLVDCLSTKPFPLSGKASLCPVNDEVQRSVEKSCHVDRRVRGDVDGGGARASPFVNYGDFAGVEGPGLALF